MYRTALRVARRVGGCENESRDGREARESWKEALDLQVLWGMSGVIVLLGIAFLLSTNRRAVDPRVVIGALIIQISFAFIVLYWDLGRSALQVLTEGVQAVIDTSNDGIEFLFGPILPEEGVVFAFQVLPIIIFFASLTSVLYYLRILPWVVKILGGALQRVLGTSSPESLSVTADIFLGPTEAPLVVRPYIERMTELRALHRHGRRSRERRGLHACRVLAARRAAGVPARRELHDRPGGAADGQDHDARDRGARVAQARAGGRGRNPEDDMLQYSNVIDAAAQRRRGRPQAGPQRRRDAHSLHLADRAR